MNNRVAILVTIGCLLLFSGCGECGRRLFFFTDVTDPSETKVEGATVSVRCVDARDGSSLMDSATTDSSGAASPAPHALNRECPSDAQAHASYFESCEVTVTAPGFQEATRSFSGAELDDLPEESAGQAGHGVRLEVALTPQ